ncbi:hypothetical protein GGI15_003868 [Coemansia interrupta]|uniref:Uncharacterized protein n=1 Tax=Coemansia interrupta TaxID=1126814 RepID=A0A9W8HAB2_9FUNG|nr:hypothetical protein GGI15_003868 [Coemansia interrupta]
MRQPPSSDTSSSPSLPPSSGSSSSESSESLPPPRAESFQAVWKLYCKHCSVLWSSRGMEAVVMARPAIRCFSTDLPPLGCDVISQPVAGAIHDTIVDSGCTTCSSLAHHARRFDLAPTGPCDCHVQDIACLGCGNIVGYYIHRPCFRCLAQRLRIKQRGFQHLWTFYQDNVRAVHRENERGRVVAWDDLPVPPPPTATAIRSTNAVATRRVVPAEAAAAPAARTSQTASERTMQSLFGSSSSSASQSPPSPAQPAQPTLAEQTRRFARARDAATIDAADPTPPRRTTQYVSLPPARPPRRDEVMEPLCPAKPTSAAAPAPPPGLCNWLFQVGLDCMVKWEEGTLSR